MIYIYLQSGTLTIYDPVYTECSLRRCDQLESCIPFFITLDILTMAIPLIFNVVSYTLIVKKLSDCSMNTKIIVAKAILTSLMFSFAWLPFFIVFRIMDEGSDHIYRMVTTTLLVNTITTPILNITPNHVIAKCLTRCLQLRRPSKSSEKKVDDQKQPEL